jgi:acetylglutamate kinase
LKIENQLRADVLTDALPYIQKYHQKIVVVKYGGNAMTSDELKDYVMKDLVLLSLIGIKIVLVHGGGPEINDMLARVGKQPKFINGLRYTDQETMEIVQMVLAGKINKNLVAQLEKNGGKALGLCGMDASMIQAQKLTGPDDLGFVGEVTQINPEPIFTALDQGYIPVVSTIGIGDDQQSYNINADTAAAKIAAALCAENLILMSDIKGLLLDKDDESTLVQSVHVSEVPRLKQQGIISGGMIPKIDCCVEAIRRGVKRSIIIDGRTPHSILIELLSKEGVGTMFY